ncbi:HTH gntR-type domain-containing protein [Hyphomicrobiales bacterium]|nr:HTH gntR-type domain-containing protein [Hyphomicrobiales bacterium]CAH1693223.1 HTH gntR-type domain-containing protein [Hyphomicrobiales bacterium]
MKPLGEGTEWVAEVKAGNLSRAEAVYRQIRQGIRSGRYKPGDRLREAELATQLDVSRTPIREAINRLVSDRLVEVAPSRGVMVVQLDRQQVRELYALREALEGTAAGFAARHASAAEIEMMYELLAASKEALGPADAAAANTRFHQAIHESAHNRYLGLALEQLSDSLALLPGTTFEEPGRAETAIGEHLAILEAIAEREPERADEAARLHIRHAGQVRFRMMFKNL